MLLSTVLVSADGGAPIRLSRLRRGPTLVGRGGKRAAVGDRIHGVLDRQPTLVWIEGQAGAGKSVRRAASTATHPFTGTLELLACLERLGSETSDVAPDPQTGETS